MNNAREDEKNQHSPSNEDTCNLRGFVMENFVHRYTHAQIIDFLSVYQAFPILTNPYKQTKIKAPA